MSRFPLDKFEEQRTPFYYYDINLLRQTIEAIKKACPDEHFKVHYAIKANANPTILAELRNAGFGADCVSGGEVKVAYNAGFSNNDIFFAGVGKSDEEIETGLDLKIGCFNVESIEELEVINEIAISKRVKAPVAFRVNPDIDAHTHEYITTGLAENKFGIPLENLDAVIEKAMGMSGVEVKGLHFHIGSQITINEPFKLLSEKINKLQNHFNSKGVFFKIINVVGGLVIDYDTPYANPIPNFESYFATFREHLKLRDGQELHFELGRSIVGQCGSLITKVLYVKKGLEKNFVIVDAGMTDLIRPALYGAHHKIENLTSNGIPTKYDVGGPICESSDCFGKDELFPETIKGDLIALRSAGAYGETMASRYNCRELPGSFFT